MCNELEKIWKEEDVVYFQLPSRYMPTGIEKIHAKRQFAQQVCEPRFKCGFSHVTSALLSRYSPITCIHLFM
jgi:hypothetical protein